MKKGEGEYLAAEENAENVVCPQFSKRIRKECLPRGRREDV